ncbi:response regulator transcription factor [Isobaculum melis]|uniref:DNA-binding response regulator, OmpR family, contains REC and winged-helix (WHTH) domain n=1 Tax=Isobaculum melis TaxID=142588 RepID=A0A1H9PY26_9LACT|nr:response regulator transcription factor [Isobaculum melis]SER53206.1 DNA-binding response regulator, OmpR family, contains REC and winged-helix (wHTH) domain [Isobaculum melis]
MKKMLIVDDNKQITTVLESYAKTEGYQCEIAKDGEEAIVLFQQFQPDILLLDVMMPKKDGFQVCQEIRKQSTVPIIMITAKSEDYDKIMGLDMGADDYIVKPFSPAEIMARVRAILRRVSVQEATNEQQVCEDLVIDMQQYEVKIKGIAASLTKKEIELLWLLSTNKNKTFSRENLLDSLWGIDYYGDSRTVDSHIKRLRAKIEAIGQTKWSIQTIWGVGYKFEDN